MKVKNLDASAGKCPKEVSVRYYHACILRLLFKINIIIISLHIAIAHVSTLLNQKCGIVMVIVINYKND